MPQFSTTREADTPNDGRADFDPLFGRWNVHHRRLQKRLEGDTNWDEFSGVSEMRPLMDGLDVDNNRLELPTGVDETLERALDPYVAGIVKFSDTGRPRGFYELDELWSNAFPMVLPPDRDDGIGIVLLNSNADSHFSFTNALGMVSADQFSAVAAVFAQYPRACWIVCIHHHVIEYPRAGVALSERIGTALINGQWFVRRLQPFADKIVVMHGHRHFDWFGRCGAFPILSAPSTVMGGTDDAPTRFYIHTRSRSEPAAR